MTHLQKYFGNKILILGGIFVSALVLRLWLLIEVVRIGLHVDEIQSATHAYLPVLELLKSVDLYDPHPPLYYVQLHFWMYLGKSDLWLKSNSVLWSLLTLISLYIIARRIFDQRVALLVGAFYSVAAFSISYSVEVRMQAFLMFLGVWVYYFAHQFIKGRDLIWTGTGLLLTQLAFLYSHGAGFLIFASIISYAVLQYLDGVRNERLNKQVFIWLVVIELLILAFYIPWLIRANTIYLGHTLVPGWRDIAYTFAQLLFGMKIVLMRYLEPLLVFAMILMLCISLALFVDRRSRILAISFVFVPIAASIVVSYVVRPIWVTWTMAYIVPFICFGIAIVSANLFSEFTLANVVAARRLGGLILIGVFFFGSIAGLIFQQFNYLPWSHMKEAVGLIKQNVDSADIIYVPNGRFFWGVSWYYLGPGSFYTLEPNYLMSAEDGVRLVSLPALQNIREKGNTYWIVHRDIDEIGAFFEDHDYVDRQIVGTFRNVIVERVQTGEN